MKGQSADFPLFYSSGSALKQSNSRNPSARTPKAQHHSKEHYPDTPTDYTKSSSGADVQSLERTIAILKKENQELRSTIIYMKKNEFYQITSERARSLIQQNQQYRHQLKKITAELQQLKIEKDFLERNNLNLKEQCSELIKKINLLPRLSKLKLSADVSRVNTQNPPMDSYPSDEYTNACKYLKASSLQKRLTSRSVKSKLNSKLQQVNLYQRNKRALPQVKSSKQLKKLNEQYCLYKTTY